MLLTRRPPRFDVRHQAFLYQLQAVEAVRGLEYSALFHEQGLGKTKIGIDLALSWLTNGTVDSVIIVTKRGLVRNWTEEIAAHTFMEARLLSQDKSANFFAFNSPAPLYLTHYEVLRSEQKRLALFQKTRRLGIILDEAHKIKNPDADVTKALQALSEGFVRRAIMTGTPVANRPYDIWSQIRFLDGGRSLGPSYADFRASVDLRNDLTDDTRAQGAFEDGLGSIFAKIKPFTVRERKDTAGIELPQKHVENIPVKLEEAQAQLYESFRVQMRAEVMRDGEPVVDDAEDVLKRLLRLVQVASNPMLIDQSYVNQPGKLPAARKLVHTALGEGSKIILWTNFVANADWLGEQFFELGSAVVHGDKSQTEREDALSRFKRDPTTRVLIATPASAKEGLTLTVANHAVFFDRSFSLDDYLQAQDRIHRISQDRECYVWNLVASDTVDEWVDMLLAAKHLAAQLAQGDIDRDEYRRRADYDFGRVIREILNGGSDDVIA